MKELKKAQTPYGYLVVGLYDKHGKNKQIFVHVLIVEAFLRKKTKNECTNHKDRNKTNNNLNNLEIVSCSENSFFKKMNRAKLKSKYRGVYFRSDVKRNKPWTARIKKCGKLILIGDFKTEVEARKAHIKKAKELYGAVYCSIL